MIRIRLRMEPRDSSDLLLILEKILEAWLPEMERSPPLVGRRGPFKKMY